MTSSSASSLPGLPGPSGTRLGERFEQSLMPNYGLPPLALVRGDGSQVWDEDGNAYLDLIGGIAVSSLGHGHPALVEAVSTQVATLAHSSNLFINAPEVALAERILDLLGTPGRVFFANSGTEANECALKLAIKYAKSTGRSYFVAAENGFHGRSMGALALTGKASIREPFGPFALDVRFVPYGDAEALRAAVTEDCAAVFLEPTLGEGGVVPPPAGYFAAARDLCTATGALFVADEIQSAIGRTGSWFAHQHEDVLPDILTLAKGLGGGLPIGACIGLGPYGELFDKGDHGSTFGGNPVSCAAALAVLDTIDKEGLLANTTRVGARLKEGIAAIDHPLVACVRGRGLWLALVTNGPNAASIQDAARASGFLVNAVQPDAVRLAPPLILTLDQANAFLDALPTILDTALHTSGAKAQSEATAPNAATARANPTPNVHPVSESGSATGDGTDSGDESVTGDDPDIGDSSMSAAGSVAEDGSGSSLGFASKEDA